MRFARHMVAAASALALLQGCAATTPEGFSRTSASSSSHRRIAQNPSRGISGAFATAESATQSTVEVSGKTIPYRAVAGRIIVHRSDGSDTGTSERGSAAAEQPEAALFYVAYLKEGGGSGRRPLTFLFNGGPGSPSVWLHMGAFGPRRLTIGDDARTSAAPVRLVSNEYTLLDASDLVFVDAPGTGFGRIRGKDAKKVFYGTDADVDAFAEFVTGFLSQYGRWNSPKYLVGEGYGAARAAALINALETRHHTDFNGVILLSPVLNSEFLGSSLHLDRFNPGLDLPYELALPSFAAAAWYHHKLPGGRQPLEPLLGKVRRFALTSYARALRQGSLLSPARRSALLEKLHQYTGLPVSYIDRANLRIDRGEFEKELLGASDATLSQLDSRVAGPAIDSLSERAGYDPQEAAVGSAYMAAFNQYVRGTLHFGYGMTYESSAPVLGRWSFWHAPPGQSDPVQQWANVMPDIANALKYDPRLKIMVNEGYFDLSTPFMQGWYEMHHLQIQPRLQGNIEYHFYRCGHMGFVHLPQLERLHDQIAGFIAATDRAAVGHALGTGVAPSEGRAAFHLE
jgi:carboxypeptidase C (cathepsin A)